MPPKCAKTELYFSLYSYILILLWYLELPVHDCMTVTATFSGQKTCDGSDTVLSGSAQNKHVMVGKGHDYLIHQFI